jgi:hypothetical protein
VSRALLEKENVMKYLCLVYLRVGSIEVRPIRPIRELAAQAESQQRKNNSQRSG